MFKKLLIVLSFCFLLGIQLQAWPWDSPEKRARNLVMQLEKFASKVDNFDELTGLGWDPAFRKLGKEIDESGNEIVPLLINEMLDTTNTVLFRYLCEISIVDVKGINKESADKIIEALVKLLRDKREDKELRDYTTVALLTIGKQSTEFEERKTEWAHWVPLLTQDKRIEIANNLLAVALDRDEGSSQGSVRWQAIRALTTFDDYADIIIDSLSKYLDSPYPHIRAITVNTIGGLGVKEKSERISNIFVKELEKGKEDLAGEQVIYWIKVLKVKEAIPLFLEALETGKYCSKAKAAKILGEWKVEQAKDELISLLEKGNFDEKCRAAEALGNIGSKKAVEPLIKVLGKNLSVTNRASEALGKIGDPKAIKPLLEIFKDGEKYYLGATESVPMALMALGSTEAIPLIEERYNRLQEKYPNSGVWSNVHSNLQRFKKGERIRYQEN